MSGTPLYGGLLGSHKRPYGTTTPSVSAFLRLVTQQHQQLTSKFCSLPSLFELRLSMVDVVRPLDFQSHSFDLMSAIVSHQSASSSKSSLNLPHDDENETITAKRTAQGPQNDTQSDNDLHLLAINAQLTEISFSIADIQTRIFEIQELRHQSGVSSQNTNANSSGDSPRSSNESSRIIDQALINLDERLESISRSIQSIDETLIPLLRSVKTPTQNTSQNVDEASKITLRKHAAIIQEWESIQNEAEVLREELKEDKWLTVFRSVSEQADGMMKSLEKAVSQCQDFIWQVNKRRTAESLHAPDHPPINLETFTTILNSFESKKKYYMPSVSKILSVVDKGVSDRVTKNGECLRLHAEMRQRWHNLKERIGRIDAEMESVRRQIIEGKLDRTETESSISRGTSRSSSGYLDTPSPPRSRTQSSTSTTFSRSISPFRKFAARITNQTRTPSSKHERLSSTDPISSPSLRSRASTFFRNGHKSTHSISDLLSQASQTSSPQSPYERPKKAKWNSSTKIEPDTNATIKPVPVKRPYASQTFSSPAATSSGRRSVTPSSQASSRPWSPSNSTWSTPSTHMSPPSVSRPSSRATSISTKLNQTIPPRPRPASPSQIPTPTPYFRSPSRLSDWDDDELANSSLMQRALSPSGGGPHTSPRSTETPGPRSHTPRASGNSSRPSVSLIPVPKVSISRPGSAMSNYSGLSSPAMRAQTPESSIRARALQVPFYQSASAGRSRVLLMKLPPSSFRETSATPTSSMRSRPSSRGGLFTPTMEPNSIPVYMPGNAKDPLDVEVARVVNSVAHGFLVERVDPPLRTPPKAGEELKAQYAFSSALARKVLNCRLVVIGRSGQANGETKKVMVRVGGGWQELSMYLLSRAAGSPA